MSIHPSARQGGLGRRSLLALPAILAAAPLHAHPTVIDALGRKVHLHGTAKRIVLGFNYEEFTAVAGPEGWQRVVGFARELWAGWRPSVFRRYGAVIPNLQSMPDVGNTDDNSFSVEKVIALRPDLVIMAQWAFSVLGQQVAQLEALGIPVMVIDYNAQIPERHIASTLAIGKATGNDARAAELVALYQAKLADIQARAARGGTSPRVYIELGQGGADTIGNTYWKGMWGRILDLMGATNIAADRIPGAWGPLAPEAVLAANPEAIFIAGSSWVNRPHAVLTGFDADLATTRARLAPYAGRKGWDQLAAVRNGQVFAIEHGLCRALFDYAAMYFIAKQLWPGPFADIDPVAELRAYHERYLPVRFEGTWMARLS